jgi:hypothetical protein
MKREVLRCTASKTTLITARTGKKKKIVYAYGGAGMELSSSFGDSNRPLVNLCIPTYVGRVTWSHT